MQNTHHDTPVVAGARYRERLTPSLWIFAVTALLGPMAGIVFVPLGGVVGLIVGIAVSVLVIAALALTAPRIAVEGGVLSAGRAQIDVDYLAEAVALSGEEARHARGPGLDPRSWMLIRGGIDGLLVVRVDDPDDPVPSWVISSRTPDRLAAAIRRAQAERL